jgi:hypothetical protein
VVYDTPKPRGFQLAVVIFGVREYLFLRAKSHGRRGHLHMPRPRDQSLNSAIASMSTTM